jgi:autoinducer 2 (AI-2) kinase
MTSKKAYIIIDIGTGNVRVAVADPNGNILGVESEPARYERDEHYPESIYFDPEALWNQIRNLTKSALTASGLIEVVAITATSQREGIVAIDQQGNSIIGMPNIDHRGREWENDIPDKHEVYQLTGRYPTSLFSALKLVGLRNRRPGLWENFKTFLSISDWAQYRLCGVIGYEHSQASETLLYDVEAGGWSEKLCTVFNLDPKILPPLQSCGSVLGKVLRDQAAEMSISENALIVTGGSDTQLAIMSMQPSIDDIVIVSGTTTPVIRISGDYVTDSQERTWTSRHTDGVSFLLEANAGVTGLNYQRLKTIFYPNESYDVLESELSEVKNMECIAALGSLLADEKTPLIRGGFIFNTPVSHQLTRGDFVFATLWDIACSIFENYNSLCEVAAHDQDYIWVCGGGMQSRILRQFLADLTGKKIKIRDNYQQSSAMGGVAVCNQALGWNARAGEILDVTEPQNTSQHIVWHNEWKMTRGSLKSALCI